MRYEALRLKAAQGVSVSSILTGPNPIVQCCSLQVLLELTRLKWITEGRAATVFGERAKLLIDALDQMQARQRSLSLGVITEHEFNAIHDVAVKWREANRQINDVVECEAGPRRRMPKQPDPPHETGRHRVRRFCFKRTGSRPIVQLRRFDEGRADDRASEAAFFIDPKRALKQSSRLAVTSDPDGLQLPCSMKLSDPAQAPVDSHAAPATRAPPRHFGCALQAHRSIQRRRRDFA
jgi:hypothetical protein